MSNDNDKIKHSKRLLKNNNAIKKQLRILKHHKFNGDPVGPDEKEPHRLVKRHAMDCGNPECFLCGNPRKFWGEKTMQEQKFEMQYKSDQKTNQNNRQQ